MSTKHLTGIILVGGAGKRLGQDKAGTRIGGRTMLQHAIDRLSPVCSRFLVVGSPERPPSPASSQRPCQSLIDLLPGLGPLGGMYTGLSSSTTELNFVLACDIPLVNADLVRHLTSLAKGYQAVVPVVENWPKALHALYLRQCQEAMREALEGGELEVLRFLKRIRVRYVGEEEMRPLDPELFSFLNVNTPADLEKVRQLMTGASSGEGRS